MVVRQDTDTCLAAKCTKHSGLFNVFNHSLFGSTLTFCERVGSFPLKDFYFQRQITSLTASISPYRKKKKNALVELIMACP